jgi:hypothetical protein
MESELVKNARLAGQKFLEDKCLRRFESLVGREDYSPELKATTDKLIPGIICLFDMGSIESGELYEMAVRYFRKYPLLFPKEEVEGHFIESILSDQIEMGDQDVCTIEDEILKIHNIVPAISRILLCERMELTQYYDDRDSLYKLLLATINQSEFTYTHEETSLPVDPEKSEVEYYEIYRKGLLNDFLKRCWLVWQISYSKKAQDDSEISSQIQSLIDSYKRRHQYQFSSFGLPDWTIGAILITIGNLQERSKYIELVENLKEEIQIRWDKPGYEDRANVIGTSLVITGINLLASNRSPLVSMMQNWLAEEQIVKRKGDLGYWNQEIVSARDHESSKIWSTALVLRALTHPAPDKSVESGEIEASDAMTRLSKEETDVNRKGEFHNRWQIHFNADNSILFDGKKIDIAKAEFKLLLRLAYQLFFRIDQFGYIKIKEDEKDNFNRAVKDDDPEATLVQLGYVDPNNPDSAFGKLRNQYLKDRGLPIDPKELVQTEGKKTKRRRLSSHPRLLSFDWDGLRAHSDEKIRELTEKIYMHRHKTFDYSQHARS